MTELPKGTVTFLFTDLEGSTRLWEEEPDAMKGALARHDELVRDAIITRGGHVVKTTGDGFHAVFAIAQDALAAATDAQIYLHTEPWESTDPLRVRLGLHTCQVEMRDGDYYGSDVNRAARLMAIAHGGQVVASETVESLVRGTLPPDVELVDLGEHRLRDLSRAIGVCQVTHPDLPREFPPLQSMDVLPGNLPVQLTSFVGREAERARVVSELRDTRVVTLTGVGGVGKTRLARGRGGGAARVPDRGVVGPAGRDRDPEAVPDAVTAVFGLQARGGLSTTETLVEFLSGKDLLLVLDNCEHLLQAVASLVDAVVRECPRVRVLATSREGLNVAGERMLGVASLSVPGEAALVARSLVDADTEGVDTRYRLLETIRQYAQEHLDAGDDGDRVCTAHAAYYASFAESAITNASGPDGIEWERRLTRDLDNVNAALVWSTETQDVDTALRLLAMWERHALIDARTMSAVSSR